MRKGIVAVLLATSLLLLALGVGAASGGIYYASAEKCKSMPKVFPKYETVSYTSFAYKTMPTYYSYKSTPMYYSYMPTMYYNYMPRYSSYMPTYSSYMPTYSSYMPTYNKKIKCKPVYTMPIKCPPRHKGGMYMGYTGYMGGYMDP